MDKLFLLKELEEIILQGVEILMDNQSQPKDQKAKIPIHNQFLIPNYQVEEVIII